MTYSKTFPRTIEGSNFPKWEEVFLDIEEEKEVESKTRRDNVEIMKECISDAHTLLRERNLDFSHTDVVRIGIALFEKRASHVVYSKEEKAKSKFDEKFKEK